MAHIKTGALVQAISGSVGGLTFTRSPSGPIVRAKTAPIPPRVKYSSISRYNFSYLQRAWALTLTEPQRDRWHDWARHHMLANVWGDQLPQTGIQAFHAVNRPLLQLANPIVTTPPLTPVAATINNNELASVVRTGNLVTNLNSIFLGSPVTNHSAYIFATPPLRRPTQFPRAPLRLVNRAWAFYIQPTTNFFSYYNYRWDSPYVTTGMWIGFSARMVNYVTGAQGPTIRNLVAIA